MVSPCCLPFVDLAFDAHFKAKMLQKGNGIGKSNIGVTCATKNLKYQFLIFTHSIVP